MFASPPEFWTRQPGWQVRLLAPAAWAYGRLAARRMVGARPARPAIPVLCVGNFTTGGAGKTPAAIALAAAARAEGFKPGFISRGHGARLKGARLFDRQADTALSAGDEPVLLARHGPVAIGPDRVAGCQLLAEAGCTIAIMDDGFQSRRLGWSLALMVVDAARGLGNGRVFPAGPVRAPLDTQLRFMDALLVVGEGDAADTVIRSAARAAKPVIHALLRPVGERNVKGARVLAFSGIGHPGKFFATLKAADADVRGERPFPDHHRFTEAEAATLLAEARALEARPVTTEKDAARLDSAADPASALARLRDISLVLPVVLQVKDDDALRRLVRLAVERHGA
jgi:tetraacyldisaccharide 4'-kinase